MLALLKMASSLPGCALLNTYQNQWNCSKYELDSEGRPLNPMGRTGLRGRGVLGRWGPNHAADPIVSAFRDGCLHFIGIERRDTHEWAIPGGMVDAGEKVSATLKR